MNFNDRFKMDLMMFQILRGFWRVSEIFRAFQRVSKAFESFPEGCVGVSKGFEGFSGGCKCLQ